MTQKVFDYNIDTSVFNKYSINVVRIANVEVTNSSYTIVNQFANVAPVDNTGGYIIINGSGFSPNVQAYFNVNTSLTVTSATSTQIRAIVPAANNGNYNLYVQNPAGSTAFRIGLLKVGGPVSWQTATALPIQTTNTNVSTSIVATSDSAILSYEFVGGSLPPGLTLNSSGLITGNIQISSEYVTYSFTARATDSEYQTAEKTFTMGVANTVVFSISPAVSGKSTWILATDGPLSLTTAATQYSVIPNCNAVVNVTMWGAGGGSGQYPAPGLSPGAGGGFSRGLLKMYTSNTYAMTVGAGGGGGASARVSGGGGGATGIQTLTTNYILMVAGGGGGSWGIGVPPAYDGRGGAGGGTNGQEVTAGVSGGGGTQGAGGGGGVNAPGNNAAAGGFKSGGNGASTTLSWPAAGGAGWAPGGAGGFDSAAAGGGGGGGGYYGGGGGSYSSAAYGGGGGSGYLHPTEVLQPASNTGNRETVANTNDAIRGTAGNGGTTQGASGSAGKIYITHAYTL